MSGVISYNFITSHISPFQGDVFYCTIPFIRYSCSWKRYSFYDAVRLDTLVYNLYGITDDDTIRYIESKLYVRKTLNYLEISTKFSTFAPK